MKTHKKLILGFSVALALVIQGAFISKQAAADIAPADISKGTYTFIDGGNITGDFGPSGSFNFVDEDVLDDTYNFLPVSGGFCDPGGNYGITIDKGVDLKAPTLPAQVRLAYTQGTQCIKDKAVSLKVQVKNPEQRADKDFLSDGTNIKTFDGAKKSATFTPALNQQSLYINASNNDCKADSAILLDLSRTTGTYYEFSYRQAFENQNLDKYPGIKDYFDQDKCKVERSLKTSIQGPPLNITSPGSTPGSTNPSNETPGVTGDDEECFSSGWALSWVACPVITASQELANSMYGFVEDQLKFTVSEDGSKSKDSLGDSREEVKNTWNNFRILVSGLVVILMLVMVIGQAIGTGPFDAYTVKKMLPRLVMGVILIQLSWPIFSFVINFVDALGRGLADIMYAPFGGASAFDLNEIMKGFEGYAGTFSWIGVVGAIVGTVVAPYLLIGVLLTVLVAIFAGFLTLLFRKILIILALILVPVALIAWMMPNEGLRKYWKLWWDNFIKALMMFPLIILIIAGGRIFAKIGSGQEDNPVGFFIVLVGFFAPLFILPKTFKWGGTAMQLAGNAMTKAQTASLKKPKEVLQGFNERYQGKRADMYTPLETGVKGQFWRGLRRVQSGHMVPFSKRSRNLTLQAGTKWSAERNEEADAYLRKWVDKAESGEVTPEAVEHYNKMARDMGYTGGDLLNYDTFKDGGIGAAKWSTLPLMMDATRRGDERIQKAIMRYLPRTKSLLEFANDKFMMPNVKSDGSREWLPAYDHPVMIDQAAKNPDTYDAMIAMRSGLLASHNTPHGGATYRDVYKKAIPGTPDYDARYAAEFAGGPGSRPYLAQQMQEISEDTLGIAAGGGNRAITFHKNIRSWADSPTGRYEDGASSSLPAEKLAEIYVEASRSQAGRSKLQGLLDSPTIQAEVDAALERSGHAQFRDALGGVHDLTIRDLLESGERADQQIVSGAVPAPAPGVRPPLF